MRYIKSVIEYRLSKHPRPITFPEMLVHLYDIKMVTRKNTQDSAFLSILYERELTHYLLNKKPNFFVDVGSHIGRFSILLAKKGSEVLAIEPSSSNYNQLTKNILLNNLKNIKTLNVGCSNQEEIGNLKISGGYTGQNTFLGRGKYVEKIELKKLDTIIKKKMDKEDIIKIDVEGFEMNVLKGMRKILKSQNPILVLEVSSKKDEGIIKNFLNRYNYFNTKVLDIRNFVFEKRIR